MALGFTTVPTGSKIVIVGQCSCVTGGLLRMTTLQAMWAGAMLAWTPSILMMILLFWPRRSQRRPGPWDM